MFLYLLIYIFHFYYVHHRVCVLVNQKNKKGTCVNSYVAEVLKDDKDIENSGYISVFLISFLFCVCTFYCLIPILSLFILIPLKIDGTNISWLWVFFPFYTCFFGTFFTLCILSLFSFMCIIPTLFYFYYVKFY
jgi:hypothetical protein